MPGCLVSIPRYGIPHDARTLMVSSDDGFRDTGSKALAVFPNGRSFFDVGECFFLPYPVLPPLFSLVAFPDCALFDTRLFPDKLAPRFL